LIENTEKSLLLRFARSVIRAELITSSPIERPTEISGTLEGKRGCFVTLKKKGDLRGCIGTIEPVKPLVDGVEENSLNAAFRDPRFPPLGIDELDSVKIEISILSPPRYIEFKDGEDLKKQLKPGIHGVILSRGMNRATFLPQVWEQLPDKKIFLEHLCMKAGMENSCWNRRDIAVQIYEAYHFSE